MFPYYVLDVFSKERYKGNPLAVVEMEEDLDPSIYQNIAREFGYAETSFVRISAEQKALQVRSFTAGGFEVGGAGHNLLGAVCLTLLKKWDIFSGQQDPWVIMKDEKIPLRITRDAGGQVVVGMKQRPAVLGYPVPAEKMAAALRLSPEEVGSAYGQPIVVRTEVAHLMVPVRDVAALHRAVSQKEALQKLAAEFDFEGCYLFVGNDSGLASLPSTERSGTGSATASKPGEHTDGPIAEARFFNPGLGIVEDPGTGSAAGPLAGLLHLLGHIKTGKEYTFLQGVTMQQPCTITVSVAPDGIWVSGSSVIVMEGHLYI